MCRYAQFTLSSRQLNYRGFPLFILKKQRKKRSKKKSRHYITDKVHSGNYPDPCNGNCHKQKYNPRSRAHKPERKRNHCRGKHMPARPGMSFRIFWNHRWQFKYFIRPFPVDPGPHNRHNNKSVQRHTDGFI